MKIVVISDTHNNHKNLSLPVGDLLIHCGDITQDGSKEQTEDFLLWFHKLSFKFKIFIGGNHDKYLEKNDTEIAKNLCENVFYLRDSSKKVLGKVFWGSPYTPAYKNMAFNKERTQEMKSHWDKVPENIDVLITHGPPADILDRTYKGVRVGCHHLKIKALKIKPKFHFFGHIHESAGKINRNGTTFYNAALVNKEKKIINSPIQFTL